jgi:hypothetical protein
MKTVKSLLLGSAAGFAAITGAQAADLPMAEPVEYVKICSTYGEGFFYIPGTDTCLQISGRVRVEGYIHFDEDSLIGGDDDDTFTTRARGVVGFDARTETEWGTLRSYIEYEANNDSGQDDSADDGGYDDGSVGIEMVAGFIQFAGITAGFAPSFYDFAETSTWADFWSSEDVWTVAYTASFGSGFSATIGVEDKYYRANPADSDLDQSWPNVIAALRVDQAWGTAQISAAVQDNAGDLEDFTATVVDDEIGFGINAGVKFNIPVAEEGSYFLIQGAYSEGATSYAGGEEDFTDFSAFGIADQTITAGVAENNTLWTVGASVGIQASETVALQAGGAYYDYDDASGVAGTDFDGFLVEANVVWTPVDNLDLGLYGLYGNFENDLGVESDDIRIITRLQRDF